MRVICIDDSWDQWLSWLPVKNEIYTVLDTQPCNICPCGKSYYKLAECPLNVGFCTVCFREIDEIELSEMTVEELLKEPELEPA